MWCLSPGPHADTASGCQNLQCGFRACCRSGEWSCRAPTLPKMSHLLVIALYPGNTGCCILCHLKKCFWMKLSFWSCYFPIWSILKRASSSFFQFENSKTGEVWRPSALFSVDTPSFVCHQPLLTYKHLLQLLFGWSIWLSALWRLTVEVEHKVMSHFLTNELCHLLVSDLRSKKQEWADHRLKVTVTGQNNLHIIPHYVEDAPVVQITVSAGTATTELSTQVKDAQTEIGPLSCSVVCSNHVVQLRDTTLFNTSLLLFTFLYALHCFGHRIGPTFIGEGFLKALAEELLEKLEVDLELGQTGRSWLCTHSRLCFTVIHSAAGVLLLFKSLAWGGNVQFIEQ